MFIRQQISIFDWYLKDLVTLKTEVIAENSILHYRNKDVLHYIITLFTVIINHNNI